MNPFIHPRAQSQVSQGSDSADQTQLGLQRAELRVGTRIWDTGMKDKGHPTEFGIPITPGTAQAAKLWFKSLIKLMINSD